MDGLIALFVIATLIVMLDVAAVLFGADSRDGFTDDRTGPSLH